MAELFLIRHAQASFGAEDYDRLSDLGHRQSEAVGAWMRDAGWVPDRVVSGTMLRHRETLASMGIRSDVDDHAGLNEYDFKDLLEARFADGVPDLVRGDRKTHFRTLRETVLAWQDGQLPDASESWARFEARTLDGLRHACDTDARRVLVMSSGGVIGQIVRHLLEAPARMMMELNLQVKNTSVTKLVFSGPRIFVHQFNATPHFDAAPDLLSYS